MSTRNVVFGLAIGLAGACGGNDRPPPLDQSALDHWTEAETTTSGGRRESQTLGGERRATTRGASADGRSQAAADGSFAFRDAPLTDALRFLAERAGIRLVADGLAGVVNLELRDVSPREALEMVAWQHHVELQWQGETLIARMRE